MRPIRRGATRRMWLPGLLAAALAVSACSRSGSPAASGTTGEPSAGGPSTAASTGRPFPVTLTDDDGVSVTLRTPPTRIVTWGPSNTEILFALGIGSRVVGVSGSFDDYPPAARTLPRIADSSGIRPDMEKLVTLHPDLVVNAFLGGQDWKARVRSLGIPVFSVYASSFPDALHDIRTIGALTGSEPAATRLTASMASRVAAVQAGVRSQPAVTCFLEEGYPGIYTVGPHSFLFDLLERAGCDPVTATATTDYPAWSVEKLVQENPTVYLVTSDSASSVAAVAKRPGFGALSAVRDHRVYIVDADLVTRPGPRVVAGLETLARDLHPGAFAP